MRQWLKSQLLPTIGVGLVLFVCINLFVLTLADVASDPAAPIGGSFISSSLLNHPLASAHNQAPHQLTPQAGRCGVLDAPCSEVWR